MTYELLQDFLKNNPWARSRPARPWTSIASEIEIFARASTKSEKSTWFKERKISDSTFLSSITLADGMEPWSPALLQDIYPIPGFQSVVPIVVPSEVTTFFEEFLAEWAIGRNDQRLVSDFVEPARIAAGAGLEKFVDAKIVALTVLRMWRVRDHGRVTALGHAAPSGGLGRFKDLTVLVANQLGYARFETLGDALVPFGGKTGSRFIVAPLPGAQYTALLQFRHTPYDVLAVGADRVDGRWRVVSVRWTVEH